MSRRHKEKEENRQIQQLKASQGDDPVTDRPDKGSASRRITIGNALHLKNFGAISALSIVNHIIAIGSKNRPGRPAIEQLCNRVKDSKVCQWAKGVFWKIYHQPISLAKEVTQYLVCFLCSLFRIYNTTEAEGRIAHFRRMMLPHIVNMPTVRNLQKYYRWFVDWKKAAIQTAKEKKDERKHRAWKVLEQLIYEYLHPLTLQVAIA